MISINDSEEILKKEYHFDNFSYLLSELLLDDYSKDSHDVIFSSNFFKSIKQIGYSLHCDLSVFEIVLSKGVQNRRVSITQEMFRLLRRLRINNAIVAFVNEDFRNYRISLLTSKYEYSEEKIIKVLSNPRRFSYSLGYGTKTKTAYKFLISKGKVSNLEELVSRFSVEVVNKQFYTEIATSFTQLIGGERNGVSYLPELLIKGEKDQKRYAEFAVRLIGRKVFCRFLCEKHSEEGTPLLPLEWFEISKVKESDNYYHQVLEPLFFELLNTNQKRRKNEFNTETFKMVPYLNGGLFSPHIDDHYCYDRVNHCGKNETINIPNDWFIRFFKTLNEYNFTVDENTSYDIELSIDPEMLGRIFENLLAEINPETGENAKKSTGSFYTPRDIVDYMVDSSLATYLNSKTNIDYKKIKALLSYTKEDDDLAVFNETEKKDIINALYTVTVLDPACGSGAFPIGMLQKIVYVLQELDPNATMWFEKTTENIDPLFKKEIKNKFDNGSLNYIRKLSVIKNSIFGIDLQPIAVEISRLRCFLSLIIEEKVADYEPNRGINPLPNLDFKFIIANSLIKLDEGMQISLFEDSSDIDALKSVRDEYFNSDSERRAELKLDFANIQKNMLLQNIHSQKNVSKRYYQLSAWKPFENDSTEWFDQDWMFGIKDGFDIVIGNPPYVQLSKQATNDAVAEQALINYRKYLKDTYKTSAGRQNLFIYMMLRGLDILKNKGVLTFIIPNTILTQEYYKDIRKKILTECTLNSIVQIKGLKFNAVVETTILSIKKETLKNDYSIDLLADDDSYSIFGTLSRNEVLKDSNATLSIHPTSFVDRLINSAEPLSTYAEVNQGIAMKGSLEPHLRNSAQDPSCKKVLTGKEINKYRVSWDGKYLKYDVSKIHSCKRTDIFETSEKLLFRRTSADLIFAYDNNQFYAFNTLVVVNLKEEKNERDLLKYILGLLNSKLLNFIYKSKYKSEKVTFSEIQANSVKKLPIVISTKNKQKIIELVERLLSSQGSEDSTAISHELDLLVYETYCLSEEEITIVENDA